MKNHTFVIPAYEESPYLEECIRHLKAQTVQSHIIITTSTPTSHARQLANKYGLDYYVNAESNGIASDWNFALLKATTPLVTLAHQDDIYEPNYTQAITEQFAASRPDDILIAFTGYQDMVNNELIPAGLNALVKSILLLPFIFSKKIANRALKKTVLLFGDPICCPSVTFNKAAIGNFEFSDQYQCVLDWYAWYRLSKQSGSFLYIDKKLVRHRIHSASQTTRQLNGGSRRQEELKLFELMWGKHFAKLIAGVYAFGHRHNQTN